MHCAVLQQWSQGTRLVAIVICSVQSAECIGILYHKPLSCQECVTPTGEAILRRELQQNTDSENAIKQLRISTGGTICVDVSQMGISHSSTVMS